jgi:hypothetical protein
MNWLRLIVAAVTLTTGVILPADLAAKTNENTKSQKGTGGPQRVLTLDGSFVHNVGELQMHVTNWGMFGSRPGTLAGYGEAPSAQWPAGSGVEYLYGAGLWVGAIKGGVPAVSTSFFDLYEFLPTMDPRDTIYRSAEGDRGGDRSPSPTADDDGDGRIDEDWRNGRDDDGDGLIDEDFAAVSKQMFSCWYTDDQPLSTEINPQHNPLHLLVRQESYQWEEDRFDDFIGINFWITNISTDLLENVYIGFFADCDAGSRDVDEYYKDDLTGFFNNPMKCTDLAPVSLDVAYTYDADGDDGATPGFFGVMFLGHTTDPPGEFAPKRVGITSYTYFSGEAPYEEGGDPDNDFQRYELLSLERPRRDAVNPRDYRMLVGAGPFNELLPGSTLVFQTAFVIGEGLAGMEENAASAQLTYNGAWFDLDNDPWTGVAGRETPVTGPAVVWVDSCNGTNVPVEWLARTPIWINNDCAIEHLAMQYCGYTLEDSMKFMTGVGGNETQLHWMVGTAPPPPNMRVDPNAGDGLVLYWDNFSETVPDVKTLEDDFEGYLVWRADNWKRPTGTSTRNGPEHALWKLLFRMDLVNGFGEDTGLESCRYEPLAHILTQQRKRDLIEAIKEYLVEYPDGDPPCPPGVTEEVCDTLNALAEWELGTAGGRQYYRHVDTKVHRGRPYFYAVTAMDHGVGDNGVLREGKTGDPSSNFLFVEPGTPAQRDYAYDPGKIYVVPNPATTESMAPWALGPNNEDPTGVKVEFRNLPSSKGTIRVYTVAGDLVQLLEFDGRKGAGTAEWDLVTRNGQDVASGVYIYAVESENSVFKRKVGKFVIIR